MVDAHSRRLRLAIRLAARHLRGWEGQAKLAWIAPSADKTRMRSARLSLFDVVRKAYRGALREDAQYSCASWAQQGTSGRGFALEISGFTTSAAPLRAFQHATDVVR